MSSPLKPKSAEVKRRLRSSKRTGVENIHHEEIGPGLVSGWSISTQAILWGVGSCSPLLPLCPALEKHVKETTGQDGVHSTRRGKSCLNEPLRALVREYQKRSDMDAYDPFSQLLESLCLKATSEI